MSIIHGSFCFTQDKAKKAAVNPDAIARLNASATELHKEYSQLKMIANNDFEELKQMFKQVMMGGMRIWYLLCCLSFLSSFKEIKLRCCYLMLTIWEEYR